MLKLPYRKRGYFMIGVYKITNKINGDCYVGSSKDIGERWKKHIYSHKSKGKHYEYFIYRAMRKYGVENFEFEILEICEDSKRIPLEQHYYEMLKPKYNMIEPKQNPMENPEVVKKAKIACKIAWNNRSDQSKQKALDNLKKGWGNESFNNNQIPSKKVKSIKISDGTEMLFDSLSEAGRHLDIPRSSISQILNTNHIRKQSKGYTFEFVK